MIVYILIAEIPVNETIEIHLIGVYKTHEEAKHQTNYISGQWQIQPMIIDQVVSNQIITTYNSSGIRN